MTDIVSLDDYRECELLGSVNVYRQPTGEIFLGVTYMEPKKIDSVETISERFRMFAYWLDIGSSSLERQAKDFEE